MKRSFRFLTFALITAFALSGCMKEDIDDLKKRVSTLEDVVTTLDAQIQAGALVSGVTPITGGHRITFTGGTTPSIDVMDGVTPVVTVQPVDDEIHIFVNGEDTDINIKGDAAFVEFGVAEDPDNGNALSIWYTTDAEHEELAASTDDWTVLLAVGNVGQVASIVENANQGTATITMNDTDNTTYTFPLFSTAQQFEVMLVDNLGGGDYLVHFRVNPSTAVVPALSSGRWQLDLFRETRANYTVNPAPFTLVSIEPSEAGTVGQYVATLEATPEYDDNATYTLALVLTNGDALVSSGSFAVGKNGVAALDAIEAISDNVLASALETTASTEGWDTDGDGVVSYDELAGVTSLDLSSATGTASLAGIENFTGLQNLNLSGLAGVTDADLSALVNLQTLNTTNSGLTTLNLMNNTALTEVITTGSPLEWIIVTECPDLTTLEVGGSDFSTPYPLDPSLGPVGLDVTGNPLLEKLDVTDCNLASLDLTQNPALTELNISGNNGIQALDLTNNTALEALDFSDTGIAGMDLTNQTALTYLDFSGNNSTGLDLTAQATTLETLICNDNQIPGMDLSAFTELVTLDISNNLFTGIAVGSFKTSLTTLTCDGNPGHYNNDFSMWIFDVSGYDVAGSTTAPIGLTVPIASWTYDQTINSYFY